MLIAELNPTVLTARAALMGGAANGDKYAEKLLELIKKEEILSEKHGTVDELKRAELYRFSSAYGTAAWVRSKISEKMFHSLKMMSFVDLGCGYNPRGLAFEKRKYIRYYGIDLPTVIDRMKSTVMPAIGSSDRIMYHSADITDLNAIRSVIRCKEPLFIVTEGLMMYLTESEVQTVIKNISELLSEYGGVWFTGDSEERAVYEYIIRHIFGNDEDVIKSLLGSEISLQWRKLLYDNSFMTLKNTKQSEYLAAYGLSTRKVSIKLLTEGLDIPENIRKAFENTDFLVMTAVGTVASRRNDAGKSVFSLESEKMNETLIIKPKGRLDSVNAPGIIEEYEKYGAEAAKMAVIIDLADCTYISSAGVRALLMLYKRTADIKEGLSVRNIRPEILTVLRTTRLTDLI